jgi:hypothetical protein
LGEGDAQIRLLGQYGAQLLPGDRQVALRDGEQGLADTYANRLGTCRAQLVEDRPSASRVATKMRPRPFDPFGRRRLKRRRSTKREYSGARLGRHRAPVHRRIAHEQERASGRVELLPIELERGTSSEHDVHLFVTTAPRGLPVSLHDLLSGPLRGERRHADNTGPQRLTKGMPGQLGRGPRPALHLVELQRPPRLTLVHTHRVGAGPATSSEVRAEGLEPPRSPDHEDLSLARMPFRHARVTPAQAGLTQGIVTSMADTVLIHPNRDKAESKATRVGVILLLLASAGLILVVTLGGWSQLQGAQPVSFAYVLVYVGMALFVARWNRGVLPVAAALAILFAVVAAVAGPAWFERDKAGFDDPALEPSVLGLLTIILVPVQLLLIAFALRGFQQAWNVEVEVTRDEAERYRRGDREPGQVQPA